MFVNSITYLGHATNLIQMGGEVFLTDPVFSPNIFHITRRTQLSIDPANLPEISAVLISHTHLDHFDLASYKYIRTNVPIIVPEGSAKAIQRYLPNPVVEMSHFATHEIGGVKIHAVPTAHPNWFLCPFYYKHASGYVLESAESTVFFSCDSAYGPHFQDIGNMYNIDVALLPIGGYSPRWILKYHHMSPSESLQAFIDLKARVLMPIHYGTFKVSLENMDEPLELLKKAAGEKGLLDKLELGGRYAKTG